MSERMPACGIKVMDNRPSGGMIELMVSRRAVISRLVTLLLILAVFVGSLGLGGMGHAATQAADAHAQHQMHDVAGMAHGSRDGANGMQTTDADCAMAVCCFSDIEEPCADHSGTAMTACFVGVVANPALQPAPDRADKPPRRT
jgi:hypothetical protein